MDQIKNEIITSHVMKVEQDNDCDLENSRETVNPVEIKQEQVNGELICKYEAEECGIQYIKKEMQDTFEIKDENIEVPTILEFDSGKTNINNIDQAEETSFECKNVTGFQSNLISPENYVLRIRAKKVRTNIGCSLKRDTLHKHIELDDINSYKCPKCDYITTHKSNLKCHIFRKHTKATEINTLQCLKCGYSTKCKVDLKRHIFRKHTKSAELSTFECVKCSYSTKYKSDLKRHILRKHTEATELKSAECYYLTTYKWDLIKNVHTDSHKNYNPSQNVSESLSLEKKFVNFKNPIISFQEVKNFLLEVKGKDNPLEIAISYTQDISSLIKLLEFSIPYIIVRNLNQRCKRLVISLKRSTGEYTG